MAVVLSPLFVERYTLPSGGAIYSGLAIDVFTSALQTICQLNSSFCAPRLNYTEVTAYGSLDEATGKWSGAIGALVDGWADIAVSDVNENLARSRVVDFTGSWLDAPLAFLALPVLPAQGSNLFTWLLPFTPEVWWCLLGMTTLFATSLAYLERLSPFSFRNLPPVRGREELRQRVNMKDAWHRAVNSLLGQGPWGIDLSAHSARVIWWAMAFLSLFTTTFYTSSLTSILTRAVPTQPISSLADIQQGRVPFCVTSNSTAQDFILNKAAPYSIRVMQAYMTVAPTLTACLSYLLDGANPVRAVMAEAPILTYLASSGSYCNTQVVGALSAQGYYSFPLRPNSPLTPYFKDAILMLMESLELNNLVSAAQSGASGCSSGGSGGGSELTRLSLADFGGVLYSTLILVLLSWVLLAVECLVWRARGSSHKALRSLYKFCGGHYYIEAYQAEDMAAEASYEQKLAFPEKLPQQHGSSLSVNSSGMGGGNGGSAGSVCSDSMVHTANPLQSAERGSLRSLASSASLPSSFKPLGVGVEG